MSNSVEPKFNTEIFRNDFSAVVAKNYVVADVVAVRLVPQTAGSDLVAGTVLALTTTGPFANLYQPYNPIGSSGTDTAKCILLDTVKNFKSAEQPQARALFRGDVYKTKCLDLTGTVIDANGITDLGGKTYTDIDGVVILSF